MNPSLHTKEDSMNKEHEIVEEPTETEEMLPEYDFSQGVRGKYAARYRESSNIVVLADDVAQAFPNTEAVNQALRLLVQLAQENVRKQAS